jgi:hypothetical protein
LDLKESRNVLESYSYEMRDNLGEYGSYEHYLAAEPKAAFVA